LYLLPCQERPGSAERLGRREGSAVTVVKSTDVLVATDQA